MNKYIGLSTTENPKYSQFIPLVCEMWEYFGWKPIIISGRHPLLSPESFSQISRLYKPIEMKQEDYYMISDIDMLPLSDYWTPSTDKIDIYGWDLTEFNHVPMCYVGGMVSLWRTLMLYKNTIEESISQDLAGREITWTTDQDIITSKINFCYNIKLHYRGTDNNNNGYPIGRIDRSFWHLNHKTFIDCHASRPLYEHIPQIKEMLSIALPNFKSKVIK